MASLIRILNYSPTEEAHQSEEASPSGAASPNDSEQPEEPARPNGSAPPTAPKAPGGAMLMGKSNSLPDRSELGVSTIESQSVTTDAKQLVHYNGRNWALSDQTAANELVREAAYLQSDDPDQLLRLWKATPRPVYMPDPTLYEIFAVHRHKEVKNEKGEKAIWLQVQWTGFSKRDTTWEPETYVKQVASGVLNEYWSKRAKRPAKISKRVRP
ncbi:Chromo domain-like protein [Cordyceps fumosorosea ARSEF 2679]|uniref:Chromo domain-like protein n=1 Tax=Cordyceps fumosorosea (strain ARSEF 2679) TaxID=1081104 RepID=A0A167GBQ9_CORFA|nr:Chromo domain-like protein [Cordyceps fumosorosea ARSEF 2679]OAA46415.1 Chromo domain-like protein [Cordyceps fumosorosea ARSEF 2679]